MQLNWTDKTACIIASGPSLKQWQVDYTLLSNVKIIAINRSWELCPSADALYGCDAKWWKRFNGVPDFRGHRFSLEDSGHTGVYRLCNTGQHGIDFDFPGIRTGCNSGYQAINMAVHFGVRRIVLIGYDMQHTGGKMHWHADYPAGMNNPKNVDSWIQYFDEAAPILKDAGIEVINSTIETALTCFERRDIRDVI